MSEIHVSDILRRPVITEKNTRISEIGQYTFEVAPGANKIMIKDAVERIFNVDVVAVNILNVKPKKRRVLRARNFRIFGMESGWKKAIVTLAPGQSIDIFGDI